MDQRADDEERLLEGSTRDLALDTAVIEEGLGRRRKCRDLGLVTVTLAALGAVCGLLWRSGFAPSQLRGAGGPSRVLDANTVPVAVTLTDEQGLQIAEMSVSNLSCDALQNVTIEHLTMGAFVPQSTRYCPECGPGFAVACCLTYFQFDLRMPCDQLMPSTPTTVKVVIHVERGLTNNLVQWLRSLPLSATQRARLIHILEVDYGIWRLNQLASIYPSQIVEKMTLHNPALESVLRSRLATQASISSGADTNVAQAVVPNSVGAPLGIKEMINMEGIFRGVRFQPKAITTDMETVVSFRGAISGMDDATLSNAIVLTPNVQTREFVIASSDAQEASEMNGVMSAMGTSGVSSVAKSTSLSASASDGGNSASAGHSNSDSDGSSGGDSASNDYLGSVTAAATQYSMTKYFLQPQASVDIAETSVQASKEFAKALELLQSKKAAYTVSDLFAEFGSHVCLHVELGGWWKVTANFESATAQNQVAMATVTSAAIGSAVSDSKSTSLSGSAGNSTEGGSASFGHTSASSSSDASAQAAIQGESQAEGKSDSRLSMKQEWKGGMSHTNLAGWLQSLAPEHNSFWKVINRKLQGCVGVWQWTDNFEVRDSICSQFVSEYLSSMNILNFSTGLPVSAPGSTNGHYSCYCDKQDLAYTGDQGGHNRIFCEGSTGQIWCESATTWCSNPYTVHVTSTADASSLLCTSSTDPTWTSVTTTGQPLTTTTNRVHNSVSEMCEGSADIKTLTTKIDALVAATAKARMKAQVGSCDQTQGYHWVGSPASGSCVMNECTCGNEEGASGPACPVNGEEVCQPSQQAKCSAAACNVPGYWFNGTGGTDTTCVTNVCSSSGPDLTRCCAPISQGNNFLVVMSIDNGGKCFADITVSGSSATNTISYSAKVNFDKNAQTTVTVGNTMRQGFVPDKICIDLSSCTITVNNGFNPSGVTLYNGGISSSPTASTQVGCTFASWQKFSGGTSYQCSSVSPCAR